MDDELIATGSTGEERRQTPVEIAAATALPPAEYQPVRGDAAIQSEAAGVAMAAMRAAAGRIVAGVAKPVTSDQTPEQVRLPTPVTSAPAIAPEQPPLPVHVAALAAALKIAGQTEQREEPLERPAAPELLAEPPRQEPAPGEAPAADIPASGDAVPHLPPPDVQQVLAPTPPPTPAPVIARAMPEAGRLPASAVRVGVARPYRDVQAAAAAAPPPPVIMSARVPPLAAAAMTAALTSIPEPVAVPPLGRPPSLSQSLPQELPRVRPRPAGFVRRVLGTIWATVLVGVRLAILATMALVLFWTVALLAYRAIDPPASTLMLGQYVTGRSIEQRWVPIERISPNLIRAVIASEDGNFCRHRGVDWSAIDEALDKAAEDGGRLRGASTISMQTVKNLLLWPQAHFVRKVLELPLATLAEIAWGKRRMLELYLNVAEWGPGIFGAEAAAQYHFRKSAAALSVRESALLAVALPNPIERQASRPGPGMQRVARIVEGRAARPTLALGCLGLR
jgi:monofunctional glycosyltransferase